VIGDSISAAGLLLEIAMRGSDERTEGLFSYVSCEARVPDSHPLRPIRAIVDEALEVLSPDFSKLYSQIGRPSIPPEMRTPVLKGATHRPAPPG
jgi:hypothetical protein